MKITPNRGKVLLQLLDEEEQMHGNIIVPDTGDSKSKLGRVLKVGKPAIEFGAEIPMETQVDDIVAIPPLGGSKFTYKGEEYITVVEKEINAIIREENE